VKGQKNEILTRQESRPAYRTGRQALKPTQCFLFFSTAHFLKQLPTHIVHIAKAPQANAEPKALSKSVILPSLYRKSLSLNF